MKRKAWDAAADEGRFREDSTLGDEWVQRVARRLAAFGLWTIEVPAIQIRNEFTDRRAFRDDGDLFLNGHRVEVRSLGFPFQGAAEFPRRSIQVELARVLPHKKGIVAYLFVSRPTKVIVGLTAEDLTRLTEERGVWNERRGVARDWLVAPAGRLVDFEQIVNYLAERCQVKVGA